jgi:hypothetical protein
MNEFSIHHGKWSKGLLAAAGALVKYVAVPILLLFILTGLLESAGGEEFVQQLALPELTTLVALLGAIVAALTFFRGFYPMGSLSRMAFGVASMAAAGVWLWTFTKGGSIALEGSDIALGIDYMALVLLLLLAVVLRGASFVAEMLTYRKEWLATLS